MLDSWVQKITWRRDRLPILVFMVFPGSSYGEESAHNVGDLSTNPGLGRSPGGGHGKPLQYSCLENPHRQRSREGYRPWMGLKNVGHSTVQTSNLIMRTVAVTNKVMRACLGSSLN